MGLTPPPPPSAEVLERAFVAHKTGANVPASDVSKVKIKKKFFLQVMETLAVTVETGKIRLALKT